MRYFLLACVICSLFFSASCSSLGSDTDPQESMPCMIEGYVINNSPINQEDVMYSIDELEKFFGPLSIQSDERVYLEDINSRFPIQYLRKAEDRESYYIVYPVLEGGKFIVLLGTQIDLETDCCKLFCSNSLYVFNLPTESIFAELDNTSTYEDVKTLAPCTMLNTFLASSIDSYSILRDGQVVRCTYIRNEEGVLYLDEMEVISYENPHFPFSGIIYSDLIE